MITREQLEATHRRLGAVAGAVAGALARGRRPAPEKVAAWVAELRRAADELEEKK